MNRLAAALLALLCWPRPLSRACRRTSRCCSSSSRSCSTSWRMAATISAACSAPSGTRDLERLYREAPAYAAIVDTIGADLGAVARGDQGRRPHAARVHRRRDRPRHGYALAEIAGRAAAAGRRRQPARPPRFPRPARRGRLRRNAADLPAGLQLQEGRPGQGAVVENAVQLQRGLRRAAGTGWRLPGGGAALDAGRRPDRRCQMAGRRPARPPASALPPARAQCAGRALPLGPGAAVRRAGRLSHAHLRDRRRAHRRAAAGEHARRGAHFGGRGAQGRARRLCQRQCASDRPGRLHDPRPAAGPQGDLLFDLRQCAAGQPSVLAAAVAAGFRRPRSLAEPSRALARGAAGAAGQRHLPGLPSVGRDRRLPLHRPRRQIHLAAQPHRGGDIAAFPRRVAAPRRLCGGGRVRPRAEPVPAAVVRAARRLEGRWRHLLCTMPTCRSLA